MRSKKFAEAETLERNTGVNVLRHATKKPGCHAEIMEHLRNTPDPNVTSSSQVVIVGDRLFTDVMMANMMGSHAVWVKDGVVPDHGLVRYALRDWFLAVLTVLCQLSRLEKGLEDLLRRRGYCAPDLKSEFE